MKFTDKLFAKFENNQYSEESNAVKSSARIQQQQKTVEMPEQCVD